MLVSSTKLAAAESAVCAHAAHTAAADARTPRRHGKAVPTLVPPPLRRDHVAVVDGADDTDTVWRVAYALVAAPPRASATRGAARVVGGDVVHAFNVL